MKKLLFLLIILVVFFFLFRNKNTNQESIKSVLPTQVREIVEDMPGTIDTESNIPLITTIATGLDTPWAIAFLPEGDILVTERQGTVRYIGKDGKLAPDPILRVDSATEIGEGGLMGIALHPDFAEATSGKPDFNYVYFYYTYSSQGENTLNRVVRRKMENNKFGSEEIIIDQIPGAANHNGGRIKFGPDKNLYITTGDAQEPSLAQNKNSLAGKILRVTDEGKPVSGNPFDSAQGETFSKLVYSYGHRNPQGIDGDSQGRLWATEHGRSGIQSGLDELNLIEPGKNYGWPEIQGEQERAGMVKPYLHSGSSTWAPAGVAMAGSDVLFFGGLRGRSLYQEELKGDSISIKEHFKGELGRIREVIKGPDGMIYISTSNKDGRGTPAANDDRILRVNPQKL